MKRLYKSNKDKMFAGVCGGIAEYFDIDPVIVRLLFVIFFFIGGAAILAYLVGMIILPQSPVGAASETVSPTTSTSPPPADTAAASNKPAPASQNNAPLVIGILLVAVGAFFLMGNIPFLRSSYWWLRWHLKDIIVPAIFIGIGAALLINSRRKDADTEH